MAAPDYTQDGLEKEDSFQEKYEKPVRLSLHLIVKRHLPAEAPGWSQEQIIDELNKIKRIRLDRENIGEIDSLELFSARVSHLYLQSNKIQCIQNLECLPNLQVLVLSSNEIIKIEGIKHLQKLVFMDVSDNCVENSDPEEFPKSIVILNMSGNPCLKNSSHRENLIKSSPKLKQLDGEEISTREKIQAGVLSEESDDDDEIDDDEEDVEEESSNNDIISRADNYSSGSQVQHGALQGMAYKQLPKIQTSIQDFATEMLMRSQNRLEDSASDHKRHKQEITNMLIKSRIRPMPHISRPQ